MGTIYFDDPAVRQVGQETPIWFSWPRAGETFTYTYSHDQGQSFTVGTSTITEPSSNEYLIPYHVDEWLTDAGVVQYKIDDGTDEALIFVSFRGPVMGDAPTLTPSQLYTSLEEIERVFSVQGVDNFTEDYTVNTDVINEIIYRATEQVNLYLRGRYAIADLSTHIWVRKIATYIACYLLSIRRGNPALYGDLYVEAMTELELVRDGKLNPGIPGTVRMLLQTPMMDSRFFIPGRINPHRSTKLYPNQRLPYRLSNIFD